MGEKTFSFRFFCHPIFTATQEEKIIRSSLW
jgi:hypothetical protein